MKKGTAELRVQKQGLDALWSQLASQGKTRAWLADKLDIKKQAVSQWTQVPEGRLMEVSRLVGLPPARLRPDLAEMFGVKAA